MAEDRNALVRIDEHPSGTENDDAHCHALIFYFRDEVANAVPETTTPEVIVLPDTDEEMEVSQDDMVRTAEHH